jgi:ferric-dicitrate binding protein FerR (iron transport regulator)
VNHEELHHLIDLLVAGDIESAEHDKLQAFLKIDADARAVFRQLMDIESGLRQWAAESPELAQVRLGSAMTESNSASSTTASAGNAGQFKRWTTRRFSIGAILAASLIFVIGTLIWIPKWNENLVVDSRLSNGDENSPMEVALGQLLEQPDCRWQMKPVSWNGTFGSGAAVLQQGVAELKFSSGTNLILQAPCEFKVSDASTAQLLAGSVAVHVTEQSNGFVLETPDSQILDEGTEYAVSVANDATEVHVFDGSVWWVPKLEDARSADDLLERIEAGQAKQYPRSEPKIGTFIPFGRRQFVRRLELKVRRDSQGEIIAYDGFENLAGRVRRDRSGFGWTGGWIPTGQRRGKAAEIVDAPAESVFGLARDERRLMLCDVETDVRRELDPPITWDKSTELFISLILRYSDNEEGVDKSELSVSQERNRSLRVTLEPDLPGRGRALHAVASFGITSTGVPYINSGHRITRTGLSILPGEDYLCIVRLPSIESKRAPTLRLYHSSETIEPVETQTWTVEAESPVDRNPVERNPVRWIRITTGSDVVWYIDELRVGGSWQSVIGGESESSLDARSR